MGDYCYLRRLFFPSPSVEAVRLGVGCSDPRAGTRPSRARLASLAPFHRMSKEDTQNATRPWVFSLSQHKYEKAPPTRGCHRIEEAPMRGSCSSVAVRDLTAHLQISRGGRDLLLVRIIHADQARVPGFLRCRQASTRRGRMLLLLRRDAPAKGHRRHDVRQSRTRRRGHVAISVPGDRDRSRVEIREDLRRGGIGGASRFRVR